MAAQELPATSPTLTFDPEVHALYIQLSDAEVLETVKLAKSVYLDVDADGQAIGIEMLNMRCRQTQVREAHDARDRDDPA